jgi:IclR family transcriptional regulator, acetate operon repressor
MVSGLANDSVGVLDRMTSILESFDEEDGGLGISELALRADLPKSTVSRLVATLVRQRYLERDGKRVHLGVRLFELGQLAQQPRELRNAALPVMAHLRNKTGMNVHLAIRDGSEMVCVAVVRGRSVPPLTVRTGGRVPMHATALGKAVLAHSSAAEVDGIISSGLKAWTPRTIVDRERLTRQLANIRQGDPALEVREFAPEVCGVAIAVFGRSGNVIAALSVSGAADGFEVEPSASAVRAAAVALTPRLGPGGF